MERTFNPCIGHGTEMTKYIDLNRHFWPVEPDKDNDPEKIRSMYEYGVDQPLLWVNLLEKQRVVIIAEPGTGKTEEFRAITKSLRDEGKLSFFSRIELLQSNEIEVRQSLDIGSDSEFDQWMADKKEAYFFLDSVDEARLIDRKAFEFALRRFSSLIRNNLDCAKVFLSCRVSNWMATADLLLFKRYLPIPDADIIENDKDFKEKRTIGSNNQPITTTKSIGSKEKKSHYVFQLAPLNGEQIKKFSEYKGVADPITFYDAIKNSDAEIFAERPQDLLDLIEYWRFNGKLGRHFTMLDYNIQKKLEEHNPDKDFLRPLSMDESLLGAERLAAAVTFQRKRAITLPDKPVDVDLHKVSIEPKESLREWPSDKILTLLDRAIFDEAIYGTVHFHHRSVREYLVASWLKRLNNQGTSRRAIEGFLFNNKYGQEIVIPSMRPVAAWLSLWDDEIKKCVKNIAPEVLIENGDPASLPIESKKALIIKFTERYANRDYFGDSFDPTMIKRLADHRLSNTINFLLKKNKYKDPICRLLLEIVCQGKISDSVDAALPFAINEGSSHLTRRYAIKVVALAGTETQKKKLLKNLLKDISKLNRGIIGDICSFFFPKYICVPKLLIILKTVEKPSRFEYSGLKSAIDHIFENTELNLTDGKRLINGISRILKTEPYIQHRHCEVSQRYSWLLPSAIRLANQFIQKKHSFSFDPMILDLFLNFSLIAQYRDVRTSEWDKLITKAKAWPEFNHQLFWQAISNSRRRSKNKKKDPDHWQDVWWDIRSFWRPCDDNIDFLFNDLKNKSLKEDSLIALTAIFSFYVDTNRSRKLRNRLKREVSGIPHLENKLHELLQPKPMTETEKSLRRQDRYYEKRRKKREEQIESTRRENKLIITKKPNEISNVGEPHKGTVWERTVYLYEIIRDKNENNNHLGYANWRALEDEFNFEVARNFRDGCKAYWRGYNPFTFSNRRTSNSLPWPRTIGLTGLAMEAADDPQWATKINRKEAQIAANYSVCEMNGFPTWFKDLQESFPDIVTKTIGKELKWELHDSPEKDFHPHTLQALRSDNKGSNSRYQEIIYALLSKKEPSNGIVLDNSLSILLEGQILSPLKKKFCKLFCKRFKISKDIIRKLTWLTAMLYVDGIQGVGILKKWVRSIPNENTKIDIMERFCSGLTDFNGPRFDSELRDYERIEVLAELVPYIYRYIKIEDDSRHTGVYTPGQRDQAENTRSHLLNTVFNTSGRLSFDILLNLSKTITNKYVKDRMYYLAKERAALDSEFIPWSGNAIADFSVSLAKTPRSENDLYEIALVRLDDLKFDVESGDESEAVLLNKLNKETEIRTVFANRLRKSSRLLYTIGSEEELADSTRTDIRFNSPQVPSPIPIELKIADKWSFEKLSERLENQLIKQYMRVSRYGVFLLIHKGKKQRWRDSKTKKLLYFKDLIQTLERRVDLLIMKHPNVEEIKVIGIDFTARGC